MGKLTGARLSVDKTGESTSETAERFYILTTFMLVVVLILPFAYRVDIGPGPDSIRAMTWDYVEASWYSGFRLWNPLDVLPYTLLRLIFGVMLARAYLGLTTARKTLFVGVLAELQPLLLSGPLVFLVDWPGDGDPLVPLYIPLPIMLILGVILLLIFKHKKVI
ncbi:MAG: hypothetical protein ACFFD9_08900 [Candidatus Thorarchaeota archaeon]